MSRSELNTTKRLHADARGWYGVVSSVGAQINLPTQEALV